MSTVTVVAVGPFYEISVAGSGSDETTNVTLIPGNNDQAIDLAGLAEVIRQYIWDNGINPLSSRVYVNGLDSTQLYPVP